MKVQDLIQLLQQHDLDLPVMMPIPDINLDLVGGAHVSMVAQVQPQQHMSGCYTDDLSQCLPGIDCINALILDPGYGR